MNLRALTLSLALLFCAGAASLVSSTAIEAAFPDRPTPRDTLFELLPHISGARYLMTAALLSALALFLSYAFRLAHDELPRFIAIFAVMYLLRAALMALTPLDNAHGDGIFVFPIIQHGMFPSGHVAATLMFALLTDGARAPWLKRGLAALTVVVCVTMILAHGHYSIDVAGGLLLGYFVEREWRFGRLFVPLQRALASSARRPGLVESPDAHADRRPVL